MSLPDPRVFKRKARLRKNRRRAAADETSIRECGCIAASFIP